MSKKANSSKSKRLASASRKSKRNKRGVEMKKTKLERRVKYEDARDLVARKMNEFYKKVDEARRKQQDA